MPSQTFFNLSVEKQTRLMTAAHAEFSRAPLNSASISNIVKTAGISRGSFYQYFTDKTDIFYYDMSLLKHQSQKNLFDNLENASGDLLVAVRQYFIELVDEAISGKEASYYRHIFLNANYVNQRKMSFGSAHHQHRQQHLAQLKNAVDTTNLNVKTDEDLLALFQLIMSNIFQSIAAYYWSQETKQPAMTVTQVIARFDRLLDWLKNGVILNETKEKTHD